MFGVQGRRNLKIIIPAVLLCLAIFILSSYASPVPVIPIILQTRTGLVTNVYFETVTGPSTSTPSPNTSMTSPTESGSYMISKGSTGYFWSPQFATTTTINGGKWVVDLWGALGVTAIYDVPITITNSEMLTTSNIFQQKITWNPSTYSSYEASDLGNIRFYSDSSCSVPLYGWLESCTPSLSNNAASATAWVRLTHSISGKGRTTIYMAFLPTSTSYDGLYWGTSPNLSPTYSQNDNGVRVFNFYDNFAGTTITSDWNTIGAEGTYSVNNGLTINSAVVPGYTLTLKNQYTGPLIIDAYQVSTWGNWIGASFSNLQTTDTSYTLTSGSVQWVYPPQGSYFSGVCIPSGSVAFTPDPPSTTLQIVTLAVNSTSATGYQNYANSATVSGEIPLINYPGLVQLSYDSSNTEITYWFRIRAYPPSNVMPTTSIGSLTTPSGSANISIQITDSSGNVLTTMASNIQTQTLGPTKTQIIVDVDGSPIDIPRDGYVSVTIFSTSSPLIIYWGSSQYSNFQVPFRVLT